MSEPLKPWPVWRINRLIEIMDLKATGLTNAEIAEEMPISENTVSRELNSPHAADLGRRMMDRTAGLIWSLTDRQLKQIETGGLKPTSQVIQRGRLINTLATLMPKQIEQKVSGELTQEVKMINVTEEDLLSVVAPAVKELMAREARGADAAEPEEGLEEPVD